MAKIYGATVATPINPNKLKGEDGITPHIGDNGNWYIGDEDTGVKAAGADGEPGKDGQPGADGQDGTPGKSAYEYAQDGGYTGTEEEFAKKLAAGSLLVEFASTGVTDEDTGFLVFFADTPVATIIEAFNNGVAIYAALDPTGNSYAGVMTSIAVVDGLVAFEIANTVNVAKRYAIIGMIGDENDTWLGSYSDGATVGDIPVPVVKTTSEITPAEVKALMDVGQPFAVSHTDNTYGAMLFNSFVYTQVVGGVVSSTVFELGGVKFCAQLLGNITNNTWKFTAFSLAGADDIPTIPTALPNPQKLIINGTPYDGSKPINYTSVINAMIDAKIAEIPNASGVSF